MARIHTIGILGCILLMGAIVALGPYSTPDMFLEDQGINWYYWKLPERDFWAQFWAWGLYGLHQLSLWGLIAWAQIKRPKYTSGLHPVNMIAIGKAAADPCGHYSRPDVFRLMFNRKPAPPVMAFDNEAARAMGEEAVEPAE